MSRSLLPFVLLVGCAPVIDVTWLNRPPRVMESHPAESVELLTGGPPPNRSYVEVAFIVISEGPSRDISTSLEYLREQGGRLGCDAIVVKTVKENNPISGTCLAYRNRGVTLGDR